MKKLLTAYLKSISDQTSQGDSREESYYDSLKTLFSDFPLEKGRKTHVTVLPRGTEAGNPDFRIWDGDHFIVGYIEAKLPGTNLDQVSTSEQLQRYLSTFPNLILTDFYEFRLYRDGKEICRAQIGSPFLPQKLKTTPPLTNADQFQQLAGLFFSFKLPIRYTAESLAIDLAKRTCFLRDQVIREELKQEEKQKGELYGFYQAFKKYLLPNLSADDFADLYAQTITYSLFAARSRVDGEFYRRIALDYIPQTTGILRDVFQYLSIGKMSLEMEVTVDDIAAVLNAADIKSILDQYYKDGKGEDPIIHFYETFLNQYDPQTRERRGVYYTPEPVVKYIIRSVHEVLKRDFNLADGLADENVTLLDPAAGTLTFPAEAIKLAVGEYVDKYGEGGKEGFIRNHILRDFYAFELMMAPYAIGHMKIGYLLESLGYKMRDDDAFKLYLTNTLEMEEIAQSELPGVASLSEESRLAGKVKREPILVILGNPPYSVKSMNPSQTKSFFAKGEKFVQDMKIDTKGELIPKNEFAKSAGYKKHFTFIGQLVREYHYIDGKKIQERSKKPLDDDYVKFLRYGQWRISKTGYGILAMITNRNWINGPIFSAMRKSLLDTFDTIEIIDLHGDSIPTADIPKGIVDENVFDITKGVAIAIFVKKKKSIAKETKYLSVIGRRRDKYEWLEKQSAETALFKSTTPTSPEFSLLPSRKQEYPQYYEWPSITQIFDVHGSGITTARDSFVIDMDQNKLLQRIKAFRRSELDDANLHAFFQIRQKNGWDIRKAHNRIQLIPENELSEKIVEICYRPFDNRYIFYDESLVWRTARSVMNHQLFPESIGLISARSNKSNVMDHFFVSNLIMEAKCGERTTQSAIFPLFTFKKGGYDLLSESLTDTKTINIKSHILKVLGNITGPHVESFEIFYYLYSILFSNSYRGKYKDAIKVDYPRIPFTANPELFMQMSQLGERLANLHLLKSDELNQPRVKYQGEGGNQIIERPVYNAEEKRLYINKNYYFENLEPEVWTYQIGGYQVMDKYLKDRRGQTLEDPRHLIRVATALAKTIEIQEEIDAIYDGVEENLILFK